MTENKKYKYRINELLNKLAHHEYLKAVKIIPAQLEVSSLTFSNYRKIGIEDKQDIPAEKVAMLEKLFAIHPGELANYTSDVRAIADIPDNLEDIAQSLGITKS